MDKSGTKFWEGGWRFSKSKSWRFSKSKTEKRYFMDCRGEAQGVKLEERLSTSSIVIRSKHFKPLFVIENLVSKISWKNVKNTYFGRKFKINCL